MFRRNVGLSTGSASIFLPLFLSGKAGIRSAEDESKNLPIASGYYSHYRDFSHDAGNAKGKRGPANETRRARQRFRGVHNMGMMSEIMRDMQQLMNDGRMTPEQQREMADMMNQMSQIMREMLTPQPWEVEERHHRQLQEIQRRHKALIKDMQKQQKGKVQPGPKPNPEEHEH
ncbi:MAG: hypothetical protein ACYC6G_00370 [Desulfobaccales bacterium]